MQRARSATPFDWRGAGAFRSPAPVLRTQTPNDQFAV